MPLRPRPKVRRLAPPPGPLATTLAKLKARLRAAAWRSKLAEIDAPDPDPEFTLEPATDDVAPEPGEDQEPVVDPHG
jgi:hypothetical protein